MMLAQMVFSRNKEFQDENSNLPKNPSSTLEYFKSFGVGIRQVDDPFFKEGDKICGIYKRLGVYDIDDEKLCHQELEPFFCEFPNCLKSFDSLLEHDLHYNSNHRFTCSECKKHLMSPHLLDLHISEQHDSFFKILSERKPMFKCFVETCGVISKDGQERRKHCIEMHNYPHDFKFDSYNKKSMKTKKKKKKVAEVMEVNIANSKVAHTSGFFHFGHSKGGRTFAKKKDKPIEMHELMECLPQINDKKEETDDLKAHHSQIDKKEEESMEMDEITKYTPS